MSPRRPMRDRLRSLASLGRLYALPPRALTAGRRVEELPPSGIRRASQKPDRRLCAQRLAPRGDVRHGAMHRIKVGEADGVETAVSLEKRSEEHTSELQSLRHLVCRLLLE